MMGGGLLEWDSLYRADRRPSFENISQFINNELWAELNSYLQQTYGVEPKLSYSGCSMQKGWNLKYQKGGKSLCTLYPMEGLFIALVVIGERENMEMELSLPLYSDYFRQIYQETKSGMGQKWLMINVTDGEILEDVKNCIAVRMKAK